MIHIMYNKQTTLTYCSRQKASDFSAPRAVARTGRLITDSICPFHQCFFLVQIWGLYFYGCILLHHVLFVLANIARSMHYF